MTNVVLVAALLMALLYPDTSMHRIDLVTQLARRRLTDEFRKFVEERRVNSRTVFVLKDEAYELLESQLKSFLVFKQRDPENREYRKFIELVEKILSLGLARIDLSDPRVRRILYLLFQLLDSAGQQQQ